MSRLRYSYLFLHRLLTAGQPTWETTKTVSAISTLQGCRKSSVFPPPFHSRTSPKSTSSWSGATTPGGRCLLPFQMSHVRWRLLQTELLPTEAKKPNSSFVYLSLLCIFLQDLAQQKSEEMQTITVKFSAWLCKLIWKVYMCLCICMPLKVCACASDAPALPCLQ